MKRTRIVALGGFLGAGKTTTVLKALELLSARGLTGVYIANDQGTALVDTAVAVAARANAGEVLGGCFCCRFDELAATALRLADTYQPDVILAEAVGSCTDLVATVINPLKMHHARRFEIAPYTVVVDPERFAEVNGAVPKMPENTVYLFNKQLEEAQLIALNKVDLFPEAKPPVALVERLLEHAPRAEIAPYSARTGLAAKTLVSRWLGDTAPIGHVLELDYDTYAAAEADFAWLNMALSVTASGSSFQPAAWLHRVLTELGSGLQRHKAMVGHIKATISNGFDVSKASLISQNAAVHFEGVALGSAAQVRVLINARALVNPARLESLVREALEGASAAHYVGVEITHLESFRPSRPEPTHRLTWDGQPLPQ